MCKGAHDIRDHEVLKHYGTATTFLGFSYDTHKHNLNEDTKPSVLDVIVSTLNPTISFSHPGGFLPGRGLISLSDYDGEVTEILDSGRYFASDHTLLGGDFEC